MGPAWLSGQDCLDELFESSLEHAQQTSCDYGVQCFKGKEVTFNFFFLAFKIFWLL